MYSFSFGCDFPVGFRLTLSTSVIEGCVRLSIKTPSPIIPVVPVIITFMFLCFCENLFAHAKVNVTFVTNKYRVWSILEINFNKLKSVC